MPFTRAVTLTADELETVFTALREAESAAFRGARKCKQAVVRECALAQGERYRDLAHRIARSASQFGG